ncbi:MAG: ATP synthase F1 subunit delta [Acidobacteriaceae bacterium]
MSVFVLQYARVLADAVMSDKLDTKDMDRQLGDFMATFANSKELREVLENPSLKLETKLKVLDAIAPRIGMAKQMRNFIAVMVQNDRMNALDAIVTEYRREINLRLHIEEAEITSVRELTAEEKSKVEATAASLAGVQVQATYKQDPSLLGGVVLRIGDTIYDGSVRGSLEGLREKLLAN